MLFVKHATVYTPDRILEDAAVVAEKGIIVWVGPADAAPEHPGAQELDAGGQILVPGFIELQINGGFGHDFTDDPATIWPVAAELPRYGVTAFLPTIITSPREKITRGQKVICQERPNDFRGARPLGLHCEGPFLNPQKKGAHNPDYLRRPSVEEVADWTPENGVRLATLAPELPGAMEVVQTLVGQGVLVSAGHSMATYEQAAAGFDAGIRYGTHLFNAMPALGHRDPGLPGALLTDDRVCAGLIADGVHTHRSVIKLVWRALGSRRLTLVTDAMAALGMPAGKHLLGDFEVIVDATSARLADGTLAGSILSLDQALRNLIDVTGCSLTEALPAVTTTPAAVLGLEKQRGRIEPGYVADLVVLSTGLQVRTAIAGGEIVYTSR